MEMPLVVAIAIVSGWFGFIAWALYRFIRWDFGLPSVCLSRISELEDENKRLRCEIERAYTVTNAMRDDTVNAPDCKPLKWQTGTPAKEGCYLIYVGSPMPAVDWWNGEWWVEYPFDTAVKWFGPIQIPEDDS